MTGRKDDEKFRGVNNLKFYLYRVKQLFGLTR